MADETIAVYRITEVKTHALHSDPDTVVLRITAGDEVHHFSLPTAELAGLGARMVQDARLLTG